MTAGPDAGWCVDLEAGRHLVGRARHCAVVIDDPAIEPYHVLLNVDERGGIDVVQLAGRTPVATCASHIDVGDSRLDFGSRPHVTGLLLGVTVPDGLDRGGGEPVVIDVDTLAIADPDPELARGEAIFRSLHAQGLTVSACVITVPDDPSLDGCTAILELGARWRARWTPDVSQPERSVRLHAAGRAKPPVHVALSRRDRRLSAT